MSNLKKKIKGDQIPKPINIKKEKSEEDRTLHPISHFIDDRLELVKQIFGTLKPKTIMNLAPEFLKKTSLDEIEELCLNELLCISTKRLKSIIADTRCPTDTESSEDSDVEHKAEHISLEEISSDSDIGGNETRRAKKLRKSSAKRADKTNENKEPSGQISVLELLELQARARAIRSQLAMEPITKIEVKSDDDEQTAKRQPVRESGRDRRSHKNSNSSKRKSNEAATTKVLNREQTQPQTNGNNPKAAAVPQKKIKLKRNYRISTKSPEKQVESNVTAAEKAKPDPVQERANSRSASPDVIPIPTEPETLLISDSTDDESKQAPKQQKAATAAVVQPVPTPTPTPAAAPTPAEESEPEEGEVRDESETETEASNAIKLEDEQPAVIEADKKVAVESADTPSEKAVAAEEIVTESVESSQPTVVDAEQTMAIAIVDDDDQNDDVISIGGDLEMIEELATVEDEPAVKVKSEEPVKLEEPDEEDNDVISLNTSDDDHEKLQETETSSEQSWRSRYLKSSKVSQVLAASRLGKRVRDKIKKSDRAQKHNDSKAAGDEKALQQEQQQQFTSKHEDGSVEQYQELLQHRQRKSSNSSKGEK